MSRTSWDTQEEAMAYICGINELEDMVLDYAHISFTVIGPDLNPQTGKYDVELIENLDDDEDDAEEED